MPSCFVYLGWVNCSLWHLPHFHSFSISWHVNVFVMFFFISLIFVVLKWFSFRSSSSTVTLASFFFKYSGFMSYLLSELHLVWSTRFMFLILINTSIWQYHITCIYILLESNQNILNIGTRYITFEKMGGWIDVMWSSGKLSAGRGHDTQI